MSLSTNILDTLVTWEDVEKEIQKTMKTTARFGEKRTVSSVGDMKGFLSRIALVECDWIDAPEDDVLPDKLIVKISTTLALDDLAELTSSGTSSEPKKEESEEEREETERNVRRYHNLEVEMYDIIARENNSKLRTLKMYASRAFTGENKTKGFFVFDYIPNVHPVSMYVSYEQLLPVVDSIAAFSAMGERMNEEEKKATFGSDHIERNLKGLFSGNKLEKLRKELMEALGNQQEQDIDAAVQIIKMICGSSRVLNNYTNISGILGYHPILVHSDLWSGNMLFTKSSEDKIDFRALIDFQTASFSNPALDLTSIAVSCLSAEDRRKHTNAIIKRYYDSFLLNLNGVSAPFSLQQLNDSYQLCFPAAVMLNLPFVWCYAKYFGNETTLEDARRKIIGMLKDLIDMHESNVKKFPKFFQV